MYTKRTLTKQWKYNILVQILYSYFRYTARLFLGCALFVARCNIIKASCETKKERLSFRENIEKNWCEWHKRFYCTPSFLCISLLLSLTTPFPFPSEQAQWPYGWCSVILSWVNGQKYENLLQFYFNWLPALRTWYYFRFCFSFSCSVFDLTLIKNSHTLNCYSFLHKFLLKTKITNSFLVTVIVQFTTKTINSEKATLLLSIMFCSINKQKSHLLFTFKSFMFYDFMRKKSFNPGNSRPHSLPPPFSTALHRTEIPRSPFDQIWR